MSGREDQRGAQSPSAPAHGGRGKGGAGANWLRRQLAVRAGADTRRKGKRKRKRKRREGGGKMAYQTFRQEYLQVPPVTRAYTTACVLTTAAVVSGAALGPPAGLSPAPLKARPIGGGAGPGWPPAYWQSRRRVPGKGAV